MSVQQPVIYVVLGYSGSGKDTAARKLGLLESTYRSMPMANYKFSAKSKRYLEELYGLEYGFMENRELRKQPIPGHPDGTTYLDILVKHFEFCLQVDPLMQVRPVIEQARKRLATGGSACFTDVRMSGEALAIADLAETTGKALHVLYVHRDGKGPGPADRYIDSIWRGFCYHLQGDDMTAHISNCEGITELEDKLTNFWRKAHGYSN